MKYRTGFVSNSSSSSFLIYGASIDFTDEIKEKIINSKQGIKYNIHMKDMEELGNYELSEFLEYLLPNEYEVHHISYEEDLALEIGISPENQDDDITHGEWKNKIKRDLTEIFGENLAFGWAEDCSFDS